MTSPVKPSRGRQPSRRFIYQQQGSKVKSHIRDNRMAELQGLFTITSHSSVDAIVASVREKSDVISMSGKAILSSSPHVTTELLRLLQSVLSEGNFIIPSIAVALQIQSKFLSESCLESFVLVSKLFFQQITSKQAQEVFREVADVSYRITTLACKLNFAKGVVSVLRDLVDRTAFSPTCLCSIQVDFLQVCIASQMYGVALSYLKGKHFIEVDLSRSTLTPEECLRFFYYKGICHIAEKNYAQAIESFITVMSLPVSGLSLIAAKSFKKTRMLHLILHNRPLTLPTYVHPAVVGYSHEKCAGYDEVVERFARFDVEGLQSVLATSQEVFDTDKNTGLVKQVLARLRDAVVQRIAEAFSTITFAEIARRLRLHEDQVTDYLLDMVARGQIVAEIDVKSNMVALSVPSSATMSVQEATHAINSSFHQVAEITKVLRERHAAILTSPAYAARAAGLGSGGSGGGGGKGRNLSASSFKSQASMDF
eukprot:gene28462-34359_t